ncbi:hypothetical protein A5482_005385 [Cyanobacterium sp. IPPAS B-1200]|uniref:hypothetical protein n=1 Tax=Cyanobacterium sp. IPPAS B-1200 TaxID=1562720 RepID=UPI0008527CAE|nr:hypothetical protein [Cyanobacterium sp. IPPAS B-1200]OEJ78729.1 hypothetical protein A5482_02325 [Cyanobacterium sp. IPPAS B-1200]
MSEKETSIHPLVQLTLKNIDFDLSFELQQFEESQKQPVESLAVMESSPIPRDLPKQPIDYHFVSSPPEEDDDNIPVASRIITDKYSLKEILFTPWAIFGLIIFIATNALIFITWDLNSSQRQLAENNNSVAQELENNETIEESLSANNGEEISPPATPEEEVSFELPSPPNLPSPLPTDNGANVDNNNQGDNSNLYPDLKTALLSEAVMYLAQTDSQNPPTVNPEQGNVVNSANSPQYHLITDYRSAEHFAKVREMIPSAVVTNINQEIKIQLGVFSDNTEAQQQAQRLQQNQQLPVSVIATR